ncbi:MAG: ABC transporter substrate-binding protein [Sneathiella sp.]|jgi:NitT/TauT family transport system substrate-binding protein|uniref:ABC transporter substrate-binding protein n=1 Tax=Sneathiella sp. TaxID=1964365 RepID=UPI000C5D1C1F|nr:ABC transporter substrate-binding protein [Sneathiella sp.]
MNSMTRRSFKKAVIGSALALATLGASSLPAFAADKITVGALRFTSHAPSFVAYEKGYFTDEGLEVEFKFFQAAQPMAVAIASGDVDFGITAISGGLINLAEKGAVKVIGGGLQEEPGVNGQVILASKGAYDDGLTDPSKLKGRSFGITQAGSSFHYMAAKIAEKEGFSTADMKLVPLQKVGAIIGALKSGQVDAWSIVPHIGIPLAKGDAVVQIGMVADYIPDYQVTTVFTSTKNAEEKPDLVKRFLAAFSKGADDFNAALVDKTEGEDGANAMITLIHKYVYADQPIEKAAPSIQNGAMRMNKGAALNMTNITDQLDWFKAEGLVSKDIAIETLVNTSYVETF